LIWLVFVTILIHSLFQFKLYLIRKYGSKLCLRIFRSYHGFISIERYYIRVFDICRDMLFVLQSISSLEFHFVFLWFLRYQNVFSPTLIWYDFGRYYQTCLFLCFRVSDRYRNLAHMLNITIYLFYMQEMSSSRKNIYVTHIRIMSKLYYFSGEKI